MSNLYREPSKDASYQVLIHFVQAGSDEKIFLEIDRSETRMACGAMFVNESGRNEQSL